MGTQKREQPDFFEEGELDPVAAASGPAPAARPSVRRSQSGPQPAGPAKRKAGFYLSEALLNRFDTKFYELKLSGKAVANKSVLLEAALLYALDDLDRGEDSEVLRRISRSALSSHAAPG